MDIFISVVSPVYKAEKIVSVLVERIVNSLSQITNNFEIILVDDGSPDNVWSEIEKEARKDSRVVGIQLSRNFGQHHAITCGLDYCKGEWVVVMDCDLQDQPEVIPLLFQKAQEGHLVVFASRKERKDSFFKRLTSVVFKRILGYLTNNNINHRTANFGIFHRKVIDCCNQFREAHRSFAHMIRWTGFPMDFIEVEHASRFEGKSSYNFKKLIQLSFEIAISYSNKPLYFTIYFGFFTTLFAFLISTIQVIRYFLDYIKEPGYISIILSIWLFSGIIIFFLGIIGLYLSKVFDNVKGRPIYLVQKKIN